MIGYKIKVVVINNVQKKAIGAKLNEYLPPIKNIYVSNGYILIFSDNYSSLRCIEQSSTSES